MDKGAQLQNVNAAFHQRFRPADFVLERGGLPFHLQAVPQSDFVKNDRYHRMCLIRMMSAGS